MQNRGRTIRLDRLALRLGVTGLAGLDGPREVEDGDDEEGVAAERVLVGFVANSEEGRGESIGTYESSAIPAKALYQAAKEARRPKTPPALMTLALGVPSVAWRYPIPRRRKAMSRVKKRKKKATVERRVQMTRMVVKMNQPMRKNPKALVKSFLPPEAYAASMSKPPGVRMIAKESQKPPYEESAVAPKVFPTAISL
jgi:hypothetical protein